MPLDIFTPYIKALETQLRAGHASERSHYGSLGALLKGLDGHLTVTVEPAGIPGASVDFLIRRGQRTVGYIEAKDVGKSLDEAQESEQLKRYRKRFPNLVLTDFLEFRWFTDGELRATARLGRASTQGRVELADDGPEAIFQLLSDFLAHEAPSIGRPKALAQRLARLTQELRDLIIRVFQTEKKTGQLHAQFEAFRDTLIHDLSPEQFADMYAQTITYGLFAAKAQNPNQPEFSRQKAVFDLPKTNPFLRKLFGEIAGPNLDPEIAWLVDDLADVIGQADFSEVLKDFGRRTRKEDPVVHFYETFLAAFDPKVREMRGVYYTPEPVVSYIVRSVDRLLKDRFGRRKGLADENVFILDPACGTGTFLFFVIRQVYDALQRRGQKGAFSGYVARHLLPRVFGFELLMAPYAVAHMKLGIELKDLGYKFDTDERLGVYMTNTLEEAEKRSESLWAQWITDEANAAADIKREKPIMVVLGNPPYSGHSANASWRWEERGGKRRRKKTWIGRLLDDYYQCDGELLGEKTPKWLQDDYVKFLRFGQWRIEKTAEREDMVGGVLAFVTNHAYLDNPTFRGMRQSLMETFDNIYLLDIHGNYRKKEVCPDGSKDENVFDIQQGVAIGIFVKDGSRQGQPAHIHHADLWGLRKAKRHALFEKDVADTEWTEIEPRSPFYLFVPQDTERLSEYEAGWKISEVFPLNGVGMTTARDHIVIDYEADPILERARSFRDSEDSDTAVCKRLGIPLKKGWNIRRARTLIKAERDLKQHIKPVLYRPFDQRLIFYHDSLVWRTVKQVMCHMLAGENLALAIGRAGQVIGSDPWDILHVARLITEFNLYRRGGNCLFPLYLFPETKAEVGKQLELTEQFPWLPGKDGRVPNLAPKFVEAFADKLRLEFVSDGRGDLKKAFGPEDVFHYAYAVFHSPTYRERYAEFLKIDFPRLPLTSDKKLFRALCALGVELVALHLLKSPKLEDFITSYPIDGDHLVAKGYPKYKTPQEVAVLSKGESDIGRVYINKDQFFDGVPPEVWAFKIGGYQVCEKWLKDRRGRRLDIDDINHYQKIIVALSETMRVMSEIDTAVPSWPIL